MTREEVEKILIPTDYIKKLEERILILYDDYHITYKDNMVFEICINNFGNYKAMFNNIDLFHMKAENI